MGKGVVYGTSTMQKLTSKSSTEAELIGATDVMPQIIWTRYFLEAQGYEVKETLSTKTTRVQSYWKNMAEHPAVREPGISTFAIFS